MCPLLGGLSSFGVSFIGGFTVTKSFVPSHHCSSLHAVVSHKAMVNSMIGNRTMVDGRAIKITSEWAIGKEFRGYAGIMDDK